ncbi:hypothetical protein MADP09_00509 [Mycoplasma anatis]|uniref:hypothetical protein n=1 Tax=Mycoplasmopsis anatis TaxID=171279 RepID=UPI001C4EFFA2|nr:hypothetical protein [Mycoplasmopsis anatis]MBW0597658.1 hypothetical protein [Mycoplasmopsis anatis]
MKNYLSRKITAILIFLISLTIGIIFINLLFRLNARISWELNWLKENLSVENQNQINDKSTTYQLRYLTTIFSTVIIVCSLSISIISSLIICGLFSEKFNGSNLYRFILYLITIILIAMFIFLTLQPQEVVVQMKKILNGRDFWVNIKSDKISYADAFSAFLLTFILLIITFISKNSFGYLKKDIYLSRKFKSL